MLPTYPFTTLPDRAEAPVLRAQMLDGPEVWLALSYRAVRQVLSDQRFSREAAAKPGAPTHTQSALNPALLVGMDPPRHTRVRRLMASAFTPRRVERLEPRVQQIVDELLDAGPTDLLNDLATPLPVMVICELLGVPYESRDRIRQWSERIIATGAYPVEEIQAAVKELHGYLGELIAERRVNPDGALVSALIRANDDGDFLTPEELVANVELLLMAGHETTVNQIANSVLTLLQHPDQLALFRSRPDLLTPAIEELLRHTWLTLSTLPRVTTEAVEVEGVHIAEGEGVIPVIAMANRDPEAFPDPLRLDITRDGPPHLGLGHGPHFCLGAQLARLELRIAIGTLLRRYPDLALAGPAPQWREGFAMRAPNGLTVTLG